MRLMMETDIKFLLREREEEKVVIAFLVSIQRAELMMKPDGVLKMVP